MSHQVCEDLLMRVPSLSPTDWRSILLGPGGHLKSQAKSKKVRRSLDLLVYS